jgi:hypothetical protein
MISEIEGFRPSIRTGFDFSTREGKMRLRQECLEVGCGGGGGGGKVVDLSSSD